MQILVLGIWIPPLRYNKDAVSQEILIKLRM